MKPHNIKELTGYSNIAWVHRPTKVYFKVALYVDGKRVYVGQYSSLKQAVLARNEYIREHGLEDYYDIEPWNDDF